MTSRASILASVFLSLAAPSVASAGGYIIPNENARELGLSQAAVANQTGAEALFLNTAALAGPEGLNVSVSGELLINRTDWSDATRGSSSIQPQVNTPPLGAVSYGARLDNGMAWGAAVGVGVPAGGSIVWPDGWAGQQSIQSVKQLVFAIGAGAAFQPTPYLKLGVSYVRFQATEELHQKINYLDHVGDAGLAMSGGANGFGVAAEIKVPTVPLSFGINYHHSAELSLSGHAHFTDVPPSLQVMLHDQTVTETLTIPNVLFLGAAYEVMPNLTVMAAWNFERWSVYESDKFVGADDFTVEVKRHYNNAQVYRLAGEWVKTPFLPELTLRAGLLRSISDQPTETLSPSLTDGSSWALSIGGGYQLSDALRIDLGFQHAMFDAVTATGDEAFSGTYDTVVDLISVGVNWRTDLGLKRK